MRSFMLMAHSMTLLWLGLWLVFYLWRFFHLFSKISVLNGKLRLKRALRDFRGHKSRKSALGFRGQSTSLNQMSQLSINQSTKIQSCTPASSFDVELLSDSKCEGTPTPSCSTPVFANTTRKNVFSSAQNGTNFITSGAYGISTWHLPSSR